MPKVIEDKFDIKTLLKSNIKDDNKNYYDAETNKN